MNAHQNIVELLLNYQCFLAEFTLNSCQLVFEHDFSSQRVFFSICAQANLSCATDTQVQGLWAAQKWAEQTAKSEIWSLVYGSPPDAKHILLRSKRLLPPKLYRCMRGDLADIRFDDVSFKTAKIASLDLPSAAVMAVAKGSTYASPFLHFTQSLEQAENWLTAGHKSYGDPILLLLLLL